MRHEFKTLISPSPSGMGGWGNGYVLIPKAHKLAGKDYKDINELVDIHGGLTFGKYVDEKMIESWRVLSDEDLGYYMVGFDTAHYDDTLSEWSEDAVQAEADHLKKQLENL